VRRSSDPWTRFSFTPFGVASSGPPRGFFFFPTGLPFGPLPNPLLLPTLGPPLEVSPRDIFSPQIPGLGRFSRLRRRSCPWPEVGRVPSFPGRKILWYTSCGFWTPDLSIAGVSRPPPCRFFFFLLVDLFLLREAVPPLRCSRPRGSSRFREGLV